MLKFLAGPRRFVLVRIWLLLLVSSLSFELIALDTSSPSKSDSKESMDSPRYMFRRFLGVMKRDDVDAAIAYMQFPRRLSTEKKYQLAHDLFDVLNKKGRIHVAAISSEPNGRQNDGLSQEFEVIGQVDVDGLSVPVTLVQVAEEEQQVWRFAPEFVEQLPVLAEKIERSDIETNMPELLTKHQVRGIKIWQWIALLLIFLVALLLARFVAWLLLRLGRICLRYLTMEIADPMLRSFLGPLRLLSVLLIFSVAIQLIDLNLNARQALQYVIAAGFSLGFALFMFRSVDVFLDMMRQNFQKQGRSGAIAMLPPSERGLKAIIFTVAVVFILRDFGFDVTAIVAGLGVGGLAIALAGQKTIENLFGGISVILDQPVRVGDSGRFGDITGTVEDIGLRSTKVRTLDRTVVTIPNAEFSYMKLENYERRDKIRFFTVLTIRADASPDQLRFLLIQLKEVLIAHPMILKEPARVRLTNLGANGPEITIFAYVNTRDYNEYLAVAEDLNLRIISIVRDAGTDFAYATTSVIMEKFAGLSPEKQKEIEAKVEKMQREGSMPLPFYPQNWIEPRSDTLSFGQVQKDADSLSG